jgi:hypothetical protein
MNTEIVKLTIQPEPHEVSLASVLAEISQSTYTCCQSMRPCLPPPRKKKRNQKPTPKHGNILDNEYVKRQATHLLRIENKASTLSQVPETICIPVVHDQYARKDVPAEILH